MHSTEIYQWPHKDLLDVTQLSRVDTLHLLDLAASFQEINRRPVKKVPTLKGKTVVLKLKFDDFRQITRSKTLFSAVDSPETLRRVSDALLAGVDFHGRKIRLIGLAVGNSPEAGGECLQLRFDFDASDDGGPGVR